MWTESTMGIGDSFVVSAMGLTTVFLALVFLSLAIVVVSKIVGGVVKDSTTKPVQAQKPQAVAKPAVEDKGEEEIYAAIIAAISEEMRISPDKFKILDIKEI